MTIIGSAKYVSLQIPNLDTKNYFQDEMMIWNVSLTVSNLKVTEGLLRVARYKKDSISMADLVPWEELQSAKSIAQGPGSNKLLCKIPWISVLRVLIEVENLYNKLSILIFLR